MQGRIGGLLALQFGWCACGVLGCSSPEQSAAGVARDGSLDGTFDSSSSPDDGSGRGSSSSSGGGGSGSTGDAADGADAETEMDGGIEASAVCALYCDRILTNCTGWYAQYAPADAGGMTECLRACSFMDPGEAGATVGDNVACRTYHAGLSQVVPNPHCWHGGPYGYGACGTECEGFCALATDWCGAASPYDGGGDCIKTCMGMNEIDDHLGGGTYVDGGYKSTGPIGGNSLDCREYYMTQALLGGPGEQAACGKIGRDSGTCK